MSLVSYGLQDFMLTSSRSSSIMRPYIDQYKKAKEQALIRAVTLLSSLWKMIKARRRKLRLLIARELECLPVIGIKYIEALGRFNGMVI